MSKQKKTQFLYRSIEFLLSYIPAYLHIQIEFHYISNTDIPKRLFLKQSKL